MVTEVKLQMKNIHTQKYYNIIYKCFWYLIYNPHNS